MSPHARFYLVAVKENNLPKIRQRMLEWHGLQSEVPCRYKVSLSFQLINLMKLDCSPATGGT